MPTFYKQFLTVLDTVHFRFLRRQLKSDTMHHIRPGVQRHIRVNGRHKQTTLRPPHQSHRVLDLRHSHHVNNGIHERLQKDHRVNEDADGHPHQQADLRERHRTVETGEDEVQDGRHPAEDVSPEDEECGDDGLDVLVQLAAGRRLDKTLLVVPDQDEHVAVHAGHQHQWDEEQ